MKFYLLLLSSIIIISLSGCVTKIDPYEKDISSVELLQKAYQATDIRRYNLALSYYEAYLARFPEDLNGCAWAQYEIAFIYHKKGNDEKAIEFFNKLLSKYESDDGDMMPEAPKILAKKVIDTITKKKPD